LPILGAKNQTEPDMQTLVATSLLSVGEHFESSATCNWTDSQNEATKTNGLVAFGCVQFGFSHFFSPDNWTCKHYGYN